jgi:hypothetical protein
MLEVGMSTMLVESEVKLFASSQWFFEMGKFEVLLFRCSASTERPTLIRSITSSQIENALSLSPSHESSLFAARQYYDLVIIYDRSSTALPQSPPTNTTSSAQRVLYNLTTAIYEREFSKSLKRQPMLLRGGWEAWDKNVGAAGSVGNDVTREPERRGSVNDGSDATAKKAENRRAAVLPGRNGYEGSVVQNGQSYVSLLRLKNLIEKRKLTNIVGFSLPNRFLTTLLTRQLRTIHNPSRTEPESHHLEWFLLA